MNYLLLYATEINLKYITPISINKLSCIILYYHNLCNVNIVLINIYT